MTGRDEPAARAGDPTEGFRLAGPPGPDVVVPDAVLALARDRVLRPVWENELGGLTFSIGDDPDRHYVKWAPAGSALDLAAEARRLRWCAPHDTVPAVVEVGHDRDGTWLVTVGLAGTSAVDPRWQADPARAVAAIGVGLRRLHDRAPVAHCPFSWSAEARAAIAARRLHDGETRPGLLHPDHRRLDVTAALARLADRPPSDRLVVCHGDPCAPNTLVTDDGAYAGRVDLGALGVADRWADLAIATWSTVWNYGPGWEEALLDAYGVAADPERTAYYRLLWDLA